MAIIVSIEKTPTESNASVMRRFSKRARSLGHVKFMKTNRYNTRPKSPLKKKQDTLKRIEKSVAMEKLKKYGRVRQFNY